MNLSKKWMSDYVTLDVTDKQFADGMTISGSKVEGFEKEGEEIKNVVDVCCHTLLPFCTQCDRLILIPSAIHTASSSPVRCNSRQTFSQLSRAGRSSAVRMISVNP